MAATLGADVDLRAPLGGESATCCALIGQKGRLSGRPAPNAPCVYIHDRRSGTRVEVATSLAKPFAVTSSTSSTGSP